MPILGILACPYFCTGEVRCTATASGTPAGLPRTVDCCGRPMAADTPQPPEAPADVPTDDDGCGHRCVCEVVADSSLGSRVEFAPPAASAACDPFPPSWGIDLVAPPTRGLAGPSSPDAGARSGVALRLLLASLLL